MNKAKILLITGLWITLLPYLGFPLFIKNILFSISGLFLIYLAYLIYREHKSKQKTEKNFDNFSENKHSLLKEDTIENYSLEESN